MDRRTILPLRVAVVAGALLLAACQDTPEPLAPVGDLRSMAAAPHDAQDLRAWFAKSAPEVLALPQTVFADHDETANVLIFGVEHPGVANGARNALTRLGVPSSAYRIEVVEPIHFASDNLRSRHRPTVGGLQIHWSQYVCTLGFNVDHAGGRSFITNSHCTNKQGSTGNTAYYQPTSSVDGTPIAIEAHDPSYFKGGACPTGRVCRYSDASRALYESETSSSRGVIAKPTGSNDGSLTVSGSFTVSSQNNSSTSFSGTFHKVGRTTGWTSGNVTNTCATVNVSGSNITLLCQTLVQRSGTIVGGGDSGSPVFAITSGDNVQLSGILWGGSSSGDLFVFSPLKQIQDELGGLTATLDGTGGGGGDGGGDGGGGECVPKGPNGNNCK